MKKLTWNEKTVWNINAEIKEALMKTADMMGDEKLQAVRDRDLNIFEVTYTLEDLEISGITLEDVWEYICAPYVEYNHFVLAVHLAAMSDADVHYSIRHNSNPASFDYVNQTITLSVVVVDREFDVMDIYSDDVGYGWYASLADYPTVDALLRVEANFNNGLCCIKKRSA